MTKIDVISGFLGAGKTTFIKKLVAEVLKNEKVVLIENEFGEIAIDGGFLKDAGIEIKEMSQGCICCSLVGDFEKSLKEVIEKFQPERVIIEPSGVGKLSDIMKAVTDASASLDVVLNSAVTIVDAKKCRMYMKNFGEFFNNQVQYAGTVVLSRTDIADSAVVDADVEMIRGLNPNAEIITTPVAELKGERLLEIIEKRDDMLEEMRKEALNEPDGESEEEHMAHHHHHHHHHDEDDEDEHEHGHCCHHHHHDEDDDHDHDHEHEHHHHHLHQDGHDADEIFESYGWTNVPAITKEKLDSILSDLAADENTVILRAKGMLKAADADTWYYFDMVPGEYEIRNGDPDYTGKVCVIGSELDEAKLKARFF
ncbi:MAG: GTP-binding protein [Eubacteriales bacterium]|nr:GTP-binding protein [Eubacteriales bacterium]